MKYIKLFILSAALFGFSISFSQFNIGVYSGFEIANFSFMESDPNDPIRVGYSSTESESSSFFQKKIGFIYENVISERIALVWSLELAPGNYKTHQRQFLDETSNLVLEEEINEKMSGYKIGLGLDIAVFGEIQYDPLQVLINATFIQQFSVHRFDSDLKNVGSKEVNFLYSPYNLTTWEAANAESSFGTFLAIGPKVNYQLNDDIMFFGTGKYNLNLVSSDGGDLVHNNGFFVNLGVKYMVF